MSTSEQVVENDNLIGKRCHCNYYNKSIGLYPKYYCKCSAEFYRPLFAPLLGDYILIEPVETVLSGDEMYFCYQNWYGGG